jgi:hypothetical protein
MQATASQRLFDGTALGPLGADSDQDPARREHGLGLVGTSERRAAAWSCPRSSG